MSAVGSSGLLERASAGAYGIDTFTLEWQFEKQDNVKSPAVSRKKRRPVIPAHPDAEPFRTDTENWILRLTQNGAKWLITATVRGQDGISHFKEMDVRYILTYEERRPDSESRKKTAEGNSSTLQEGFSFSLDETKGRLVNFKVAVTVMGCYLMPMDSNADQNTVRQQTYFRITFPTDFVLVASDGTGVSVHQNILAASSELFKTMLTTETAEKTRGRLETGDVNKDDLTVLVEGMYRPDGDVDQITDMARLRKLYQSAAKYDIQQLMDKYDTRMLSLLPVAEYGEQYVVAKLVNLPKLARNARLAIVQKYREFLLADGEQVIFDAGKAIRKQFLLELMADMAGESLD